MAVGFCPKKLAFARKIMPLPESGGCSPLARTPMAKPPEADEIFVFKTLIFNTSAEALHQIMRCFVCLFLRSCSQSVRICCLVSSHCRSASLYLHKWISCASQTNYLMQITIRYNYNTEVWGQLGAETPAEVQGQSSRRGSRGEAP